MMHQFKNGYVKLIVEYLKQSKGPFKAEALSNFFQNKIMEDMAELIKGIEDAFINQFNKIKIQISDY